MADEFTKAALYGIKTFNRKVKEKIGMEKLIELLCEYLGEEYHGEYFEWYRDIKIPQRLDSLSELKPFIKWLVENDKIDLDEIPYLTDEHGGGFDEYEEVIMILSISDTPIDFLCEILK